MIKKVCQGRIGRHNCFLTYPPRTDGKALVKLVRPELLIQAREEKSAQAAEKAAKKALQQNAEKAKRIARIQKGKISPLDMFKSPNVEQGVYGSWDEKGLPLTDAEGVELTKSRAKKLQKEWEQQKKAHDEWLVWSKTEEGKEAEGTPGEARS
jgi:cysteinyl-tRNA synthetase